MKEKTQPKAKSKTTPKKNTSKKVVVKNKEKNVKVQAMLTIIIVTLLLLILVVGASFAYFLVNVTNDGKTSAIDVSAGDIGSVAFSSDGENLYLNLTATEMLNLGNDVSYYASKDGSTTTETKELMGQISVAGEGIFDCKYTLDIKATATSDDDNMYKRFQNMSTKSEGQIVLTVTTQDGDEIYDFNTANLFTGTNSDTISFKGDANGLEDGSPEAIYAQLKIVNKTGVVQDGLKGSDIALSFSVSEFSCEIVG